MEHRRLIASSRAAGLVLALLLGLAGAAVLAPAASAAPAGAIGDCTTVLGPDGGAGAPVVDTAPAPEQPSLPACPADPPSPRIVVGEWAVGEIDCAAGRDAVQTRATTTTPFELAEGVWFAGDAVETVETRPHVLSDAEWTELGCGVIELPPIVTVQPVATATPATCSAEGSYTLAENAPALWFVDGVETSAGTHPAPRGGTVSVEAAPVLGAFALGIRTTWAFDLTPAEGCEGAAGGGVTSPADEAPAPIAPVEAEQPVALDADQPVAVDAVRIDTETAPVVDDGSTVDVELPTLSLAATGASTGTSAGTAVDARPAADWSPLVLALLLAALGLGLITHRSSPR